MRAPIDQIKKADKKLLVVMIFCLVIGLMLITFTLHAYITHQLQKDMDWNKPVPPADYQSVLESLRILTFQAFPMIGAGFILIAYAIWDYRRKRGAINDRD